MKERTGKYLAKERVNTGRQIEVDMLKALCIICMIILHTYENLGADEHVLYTVFDLSSTFIGAVAFMICMGIGMRYSRHQEPKDYVARGVELLTVGQLLNLVRNVLPNLIAYRITGGQFFIANSLLVIQADILTFAGISFLLLALLRRLKISDGRMLGLGFVMNLAGAFLGAQTISPSNFLVSQFLGFFVLTNAEAFFPLLSYFFFVALGYYIGGLYPRIKDKEGLSTRILQIFVPVCVIWYAIRIHVEIPFLPEFNSCQQYIMEPGPDALATSMVSMILLALFYKLSVWSKGRIPGFVRHFSGNINQYYCISYVLILPMQTLLVAVRGELLQGWLIPTLYALFVIFACYLIVELNNRYLHLHVATLKNPWRAVVFTLIWVLTFVVIAYAYPRIEEYATIWNEYLLP